MSEFITLEVTGDFYGVTTTKGDIIVNNGTKNSNFAIGTDGYVLTADSTQLYGMKWAPSSSSSSVMGTQYTLSNVYTTTSTNPVQIADFTSTPSAGNYVIIVSITISTASIDESFTMGIYKNGVLVPNSNKTVRLPGNNIRYEFSISFYTSILTETLSININTSSYISPITVWEGNVVLIKVSSVYQNQLSNIFSTNSTVGSILSDFTQMPQNGMYVITFNMECSLSNTSSFSVYVNNNGSVISGSLRTIYPDPNMNTVVSITFITSFSGSDILTVGVKTQNNTVVLTVISANLLLISIA